MKKLLFAVMMAGLPFVSTFAQVSGKVLGEGSKDGLPGATVLIKGTKVGSVTDTEGNFTIPSATSTDTLDRKSVV